MTGCPSTGRRSSSTRPPAVSSSSPGPESGSARRQTYPGVMGSQGPGSSAAASGSGVPDDQPDGHVARGREAGPGVLSQHDAALAVGEGIDEAGDVAQGEPVTGVAHGQPH